MFQSQSQEFNQAKAFHAMMDGQTQELPNVYDLKTAGHRAGFKIEEIVEFLQATASSQEEFDEAIKGLHNAVDKAATKVGEKDFSEDHLTGQVDALIDLLYFTYGSFALMGVDPQPIFNIVHQANMGKIFPDGKPHFDPVTHKILKPADWEEKYAPEPAIKAELERQQQRKKPE